MVWEIREYGAVDDGRTVNTAVIQNTIDRCHQAGGGTVLIEGGVYLCGTIFLRSNVTLELLARVKSQLRRYTQLVNLCESIDSIYRVDGLEINDRNRTVTVEGREVKMTPIEYKILRLLVQERGKVLSISQIYESIWHMQAIGADNTIAVHIRHIREKIESNPKEPRYLKVVWGTGYKVG